jgi:uncharacterized protein (TIGR02677 family)
MRAEAEQAANRPSFADAPLDGDELSRLVALRAATSENTAMYIAVLAALAEAAQAYRLQLRTAEIRARLVDSPGLEAEEAAVRDILDQLRSWGCVDWVQDPSIRAISIEEYLKRHELWEITPIGTATLEAVESLLGATLESGALQRTMFRQVRATLTELSSAVNAGDAAGVYLHLRDLDLALAQLATNAREFYATVNRIAREERLDDHVFLLYKDQLIAYLQSFHDDLVRNRSLIAADLAVLDRDHRTTLLRLAEEGDDSRGPFAAGADWQQRWDGMLDWFVPGRAARSEVDALGAATTVAIRELLTLLRRLTEQATRPVNRASELRETAAWFAGSETDDEAHTLFDAAFGLSPVDHVGLTVADADAEGRNPSWWDVTPVDVPLSLRAHGRRPARGATGKRRDYSEVKRALERERQIDDERRAASAARLASIDLSQVRVAQGDWYTLLGWLDRVLADRPAGQQFSASVRVGGATISLTTADHDFRLLGPGGSVVLRNCRVEVGAQ